MRPYNALMKFVLAVLLISSLAGPVFAEPAPSPRAAEALELLKSHDGYQRSLGFLRLEALREPATLEPIRAYTASRDEEVRAYAWRAVAAIQGPSAVPALLEAYRAEKHSRVRRAILLGLEPLQASDPGVLPVFIDAMRHADQQLCMTAVDIVSRIDHPEARAAVWQRAKKEGRRDVRRVLKAAVARLPAQEITARP